MGTEMDWEGSVIPVTLGRQQGASSPGRGWEGWIQSGKGHPLDSTAEENRLISVCLRNLAYKWASWLLL